MRRSIAAYTYKQVPVGLTTNDHVGLKNDIRNRTEQQRKFEPADCDHWHQGRRGFAPGIRLKSLM
jgi:hypothetical protein